jgi:4-hydroxybenzoate polyprenyltransferase
MPERALGRLIMPAGTMARVRAIAQLVHPAPAVAVVALSAALAAILSQQSGATPLGMRVVLTVLSVAGSQVATGAMNDWADRSRDAIVQPTKPIPSGRASERSALIVAGAGLAVQVAASIPLGLAPLLLGLAAVTSALAYDLWLSRTIASFVPYLVSFGLLPVWIAAGVGAPVERVLPAAVLVAPFAVAAHLANALRDFDADARLGSGNVAQRLGRRRTKALAWALAMGVGLAVGAALALAGRLTAPAAILGLIGLVAVAQGASSAHRLWAGMLVAAVCWAAAWALATG